MPSVSSNEQISHNHHLNFAAAFSSEAVIRVTQPIKMVGDRHRNLISIQSIYYLVKLIRMAFSRYRMLPVLDLSDSWRHHHRKTSVNQQTDSYSRVSSSHSS